MGGKLSSPDQSPKDNKTLNKNGEIIKESMNSKSVRDWPS